MKVNAWQTGTDLFSHEKRSGTLWEGRYKSCPVGTNRYLLACSKYIEMNPLRAGLVDEPGKYRWSSFPAKTECTHDVRNWLDFDQHYLGLGETAEERATNYRQYALQAIPDAEKKLICEALDRGHVAGDAKFLQEVAKRIGRRLELRRQGRPRKSC